MEDRRSANASNIFYTLLCGHNINIKLFTKLSRSQIQSRSFSNFQPCRPTSLVHCRPLKTKQMWQNYLMIFQRMQRKCVYQTRQMTLKVIIQCVVDLRMNCRLESCLTCFRKTCDENHDGDDVDEREDDVETR